MLFISPERRIGNFKSLPGSLKFKKNPTGNALLLMAVPFIIFLFVFYYVPLYGWGMAFVRYIPGIPIIENQFVGLKYFKMLFSYANDFPRVMLNTLAMSFLNLFFSPLTVILAILISEVKSAKLRKFLQTSTSLPNFISMIIVYSMFLSMLAVDDGLINEILLKIGIIKEPTNLLGNESAVWYFQTFILYWKTAGWGAIIYLAAIASIDKELYDAANVDGAGRLRQILHITIPGVIPTYLVLLLLSMGNLLTSNFEQIYVFHNSLVHGKIETLDYYTYRIGLGMFDFSLSTAIGMFKSLVSITLLFTFSTLSRKLTDHSII